MGSKKIQFDDLHMDKNYTAWDAYAQSKLAQMTTGYELQRRVQKAGKKTIVYVCHPGASRTDLIKGENISLLMKISWNLLVAPFIAQPAENGGYPELMCATEDGLKDAKLYGPTKRQEMVGPVGEGTIESHVLDEKVAKKLRTLSEKTTWITWSL